MAVVVALKDVPAGTTVNDAITAGELGIKTMRSADVPDFAVTNYDSIRGQVVSQPLFTGDTVTTTRVGSSNGTSPSFQVKGQPAPDPAAALQDPGHARDVPPHDRVDIWAKVAATPTPLRFRSS